MKPIIFSALLSFLLLSGCNPEGFKQFYPYSQLPPEKVSELIPHKYDDCLTAFDTILTPEAKLNFKNLPEEVAVIDICDQIGGFFTTRWGYYRYNEQYHWPYDKARPLVTTANEVASRFIKDGIYDPHAMLRILFTCYHKYLNSTAYNWQAEIAEVKKRWPAGDPTNFSATLPDTIQKIENETMLRFRFDLLKVNDTVDILYNRAPKLTKKSADWYYLSGIIHSKNHADRSIRVRLISIDSEFGNHFIPWDNDTLYVGDTLEDSSYGWLKRGFSYFNYHSGKEYREPVR